MRTSADPACFLTHTPPVTEHHRGLALKLFQLSQKDTSEFPFMVQAIQITARCMHALRVGKLNALCNGRGNAIAAFHSFYIAMWFEFYDQWTAKAGSMATIFYIMEDVQKVCYGQPLEAVAKFERKSRAPQFQGEAAFSGMD